MKWLQLGEASRRRRHSSVATQRSGCKITSTSSLWASHGVRGIPESRIAVSSRRAGVREASWVESAGWGGASLARTSSASKRTSAKGKSPVDHPMHHPAWLTPPSTVCVTANSPCEEPGGLRPLSVCMCLFVLAHPCLDSCCPQTQALRWACQFTHVIPCMVGWLGNH